MLRTVTRGAAGGFVAGTAAVVLPASRPWASDGGCPSLRLPRLVAPASLSTPSRLYFTATQRASQQPPPVSGGASSSAAASASTTSSSAGGASSTAAGGGGGGESAMDIAMRVNRMKKAHQSSSGGAAGKKQIELEAWEALNSMGEAQVNTAEGKAVALLLNSWAYFAKFWERGRDGPTAGGGSSSPGVAPLTGAAEPTTEGGEEGKRGA